MKIHLIDHPLAAHWLTVLRDARTEPAAFRAAAARLTTLLFLEATRDLPTIPCPIETPLETMRATKLAGGIVAVPVLRAGLGMLEPLLALHPDVSVGHIGLARDHATAEASRYYGNLPPLENRPTLLLDPMLATGGSACQAIATIQAAGGRQIRFVCIVAAPEGVAAVNAAHPEVPLFAAALDRGLDPRKYILPGLGDFGDRLYGTIA